MSAGHREVQVGPFTEVERVYDFASGAVQTQPAGEDLRERHGEWHQCGPWRAYLGGDGAWHLVPGEHEGGNYLGHGIRAVVVRWSHKPRAEANLWGKL